MRPEQPGVLMGAVETGAKPEREPVLVVGPWGEDAAVTFTRFVLPLRYQPVPLDGVDLAMPAYRHRPVRDRGRLGYLTSDTASVLFRRTAWFELEPQAPGLQHPVSVPGYDGRSFQVAFQPPRLVLFEWQKEDAPARDELPPQVGFLLLRPSRPAASTEKSSPGSNGISHLREVRQQVKADFEARKALSGLIPGGAPASRARTACWGGRPRSAKGH